MKRIILTLFLSIILFCRGSAQLRENFLDGDMSYNPRWLGDTVHWRVTPEGLLQSGLQTANSVFYISTSCTVFDSAQWDLRVSILFNPSSANYIDVFIAASDTALTAPGTTGYFIRIGNTEDDICLWRKDSGSMTRLIDGMNGILNSSSSDIRLRVIHKSSGSWELWRDISASGNNYYREGSVVDSVYHSSAYFGLLVRQSTSGFFGKHFFDDIAADHFVPDTVRPRVLSLAVSADSILDIQFSEPLSMTGLSDTGNYRADGGLGSPRLVFADSLNPSVVHLLFSSAFPVRMPINVSISGLRDLSDNIMVPASREFLRYAPARFDMVIDEIMSDPSPVIGLPDAEWIEIMNRSGMPINMKGWRIACGDQISGMLPDYVLAPDSFVVITSTSSLSELQFVPHCLSVTSFPYLTNEDNIIELRAPSGLIIHAVHYKSSWYRNAVKQEGGWSLEMMDVNNPCAGENNWMASSDISGGTPGRINSNESHNPDISPPILLQGMGRDSLFIILDFSETLDSSAAADPAHYRVANGNLQILSATVVPPAFEQVILKTSGMERHVSYELYINGISDCAGLSLPQQIYVGRKENPDSGAAVINEILFDPRSGGSDYVELWNHSSSVFDLSGLYLANRNVLGQINDLVPLSLNEKPFYPGQLVVITEDSNAVKRDYTVMNPLLIIQTNDLPSFPDDTGHVVLLDRYGQIIDEVSYSEHFHFPFITDPEGVALERISPSQPSSNRDNWHSASSDAGYGTPTGPNSQYRPGLLPSGNLRLDPAVISPDNDGRDDFTCLYYSFPGSGNLLNITIYDLAGRPVRYLQQGAVAGTSGFFRWDGLDDKGKRLSPGLYVILTEVINVSGKISRYKMTAAVVYGL